MATTLAQLLPSPTKEALRAELLAQLQGVGFTSLTGYSTGTVGLTGAADAAYDIRVLIIASGILGIATFQVSLDGGVTYSGTITVPGGGSYALSAIISTSTLSLAFGAGSTTSGSAFTAGDVYRIQTRVPTLPATSWQTGSVPLTLIENDAAVLEDLYALVGKVASGGLLATAGGPWLDLLATNVYQLTRNQAVATQGVVKLTDAGAAGPFTITAGQLWFAASNGLRFTNTTGGTLPLSGTLTLTVKAEAPAAAYNVGNGAITTMVTTLPGVTVNNPNPGSGSWITISGADQEADAALVSRCKAKWPTIGIGATSAAYDYWARTADVSVTRTQVAASGTVAGTVNVYLAGASGPVTGGAVTNVVNYLASRTPLGVLVNVASCTAAPVTVTATVYVASAYLAAATAQCATNLAALFNGGTNSIGEVLPGIPLGPSTVYLSAIIEQLQLPTGVRNVVISGPGADVALTTAQVATLTQALTFVGV
jgi:uncharacterized phage protein gp47/JayE